MENQEHDRVRCSTSENQNQKIDATILITLENYKEKNREEINSRIEKLEKEWSIERWLELNASILAFIGVLLGAFLNIWWLLLPSIVLPFLSLHAIQGWCPPVPVLRALKVRTRREIDWEKFSLKAMRGDFDGMSSSDNVEQIFNRVKININ
ncbi:MAG: DUF2892 domain-containing protein [Chlamydiales bacterium]